MVLMANKKVNISLIKPNNENPRFITDSKFKKLVKSIKEFPEMLETRPLVVDENMVVLGGNMRLKALKSAGVFEVPVHQVKKWTDDQKKEFIIKDNLGYGEWDWDIVANDWDLDKLTDWGLDFPDFPQLEPEAEEDDYEEPDNLQVDVVLGDLIEIGEHRLLCGDSTDSEQVAKLMDGKKADMVFTDPPYNVAFNGRSGKFDVIENDDLPDDDFENLINGFVAILKILKPKQYYVWCNWKFYGLLQSKLDYKACIVWAKNVFGLGKGYRHQHEFCLFNGNLDDGINNETDLWEIKKDSKYMHPTQKPIELASRAFSNHKKSKNIVDLFCGSGSTIVAAHQLDRICYGMELDPKYCQVIIDRMKKLDPSLKIKINGKEYKNL
jgi:DNA modification methylase